MRKYDYSQYKTNNTENYRYQRSDNKYFNVGCLYNYVNFDDKKTLITISIDDTFEDEELIEYKNELAEKHDDFYENRENYDYAHKVQYNRKELTYPIH